MSRERRAASLVARRFFREEGRDADARIGVMQVAHEVVALLRELRGQRGTACLVEQLLDARERVGRLRVEPCSQLQRGGQRLALSASSLTKPSACSRAATLTPSP